MAVFVAANVGNEWAHGIFKECVLSCIEWIKCIELPFGVIMVSWESCIWKIYFYNSIKMSVLYSLFFSIWQREADSYIMPYFSYTYWFKTTIDRLLNASKNVQLVGNSSQNMLIFLATFSVITILWHALTVLWCM